MKRVKEPAPKLQQRNGITVTFGDARSQDAHLATTWLRSLIERAQAARALREKEAA